MYIWHIRQTMVTVMIRIATWLFLMMDIAVPLRLRELSQTPGVSIPQDFQML